MEEKKLTEVESLELITSMIRQTKKESAIGSGNIFLIWGYLCTFLSLAVFALSFVDRESGWGWLYLAIPAVGFVVTGIAVRKMSKKFKNPHTYQSDSISAVWGCLSGVFAAYMVFCFLSWGQPVVWTGLFLLGLLLPGIGTYCTGVIIKEWPLQLCGLIGAITGAKFLQELCCNGAVIGIEWPVVLALSMIISLVIPGHILNHKAKKINA